MTAEVTKTTYRDILLERLLLRNKREGAFHETVVANSRLLHQVVELQKKNDHLETLLRAQASIPQDEKGHGKGSPQNQRIAELDNRIRELNEERAEMYKTQSENAQRLVNMNEQLRLREETDKRQTQEIQRLLENVTKLTSKCDLQVQQLREKDVTIQILQDELAALQLEIVTTEERSKKLQKENAQLLQRWLDKMNQEAEKMNEATQFYESFLEQARNVGQTIRKSGGRWIMRPATEETETGPVQQDPPASIVLPTKASQKMSMHDGDIYCVQASSTGSMFATGAADKKIKLYDAKTGHVSQTLSGSLQTITSISFNATDEMVLGSSTDNATRIWNLGTSRIKHTLTGHIGKVYAAKFAADSNKVVSGSHDRTLKVWDLQKGNCMRTIFTFSSCNDLCLVDADGQTLVSGHLDGNLRLWDTRTGNGIKELTGIHTGQITSVSMAPDGSTVLTNSRDNTLKITDLRMYDIVQTFQAETYRNGINCPDGNYIAAGSADGTLHLWNVRTGLLEKAVTEHR
ncbi:hypothetical protein DFQ30_006733 [Apophysomyces sp. BC1015]|nr:hypothetical protein DFQ30_006733 [Apophysomyces sp. BC1015]